MRYFIFSSPPSEIVATKPLSHQNQSEMAQELLTVLAEQQQKGLPYQSQLVQQQPQPQLQVSKPNDEMEIAIKKKRFAQSLIEGGRTVIGNYVEPFNYSEAIKSIERVAPEVGRHWELQRWQICAMCGGVGHNYKTGCSMVKEFRRISTKEKMSKIFSTCLKEAAAQIKINNYKLVKNNAIRYADDQMQGYNSQVQKKVRQQHLQAGQDSSVDGSSDGSD